MPSIVSLQKTLIDPTKPNERYVPLGSMVGDLPELLIATIKQTRDPAHLADYLKQLGAGDPSKAGRVGGYLGLPPGDPPIGKFT